MKEISRVEKWFVEADSNFQNGNYEDGFQILETILSSYPDFAPAYNHLGWLYFVHLSDLEKAKELFLKTIELDKDYAPVYPNYAALLNALERFNDLEILVEKALKVKNVDLAALYYELATMHEIKMQYDKSQENLHLAIRYSLSNADVKIYSKALERIAIKKDLLR